MKTDRPGEHTILSETKQTQTDESCTFLSCETNKVVFLSRTGAIYIKPHYPFFVHIKAYVGEMLS